MQPKTGAIKAWVGGIDYRYFQYDHVRPEARRQVGSILKPVIYASAIEQGASPCEYISNELETYEEYENWTPKNADMQHGGLYSLQGALTNSVNTVSVKLLLEYGIAEAVALARDMGIRSEIDTVPSIALGAADLSLFEMVQAYAVFANEGRSVNPYFLQKVETKSGEVLYQADRPGYGKRAMSAKTAAIVLKMMEKVVNEGTASSLRQTYGFKGPIAGKTGTTQNHADGWFIGITPELVTGVWVGGEYPFIRFRSLAYGQGAKMALPIWAMYHQKLFNDPAFSNLALAQFRTLPATGLPEMGCDDFMEEAAEKPVEAFLQLFFGSKEERQARKEERRKRREERRRKRRESRKD